MDKLVMTGKEIYQEIAEYSDTNDLHEWNDNKFLVLPSGLDEIERMLKEEIDKVNMGSLNELEIFEGIISSVFARFK